MIMVNFQMTQAVLGHVQCVLFLKRACRMHRAGAHAGYVGAHADRGDRLVVSVSPFSCTDYLYCLTDLLGPVKQSHILSSRRNILIWLI